MKGDKSKVSPQSADLAKLKSEIVKISKEIKGQLGLYVKHVESGQEISLDADKIYPLGSVFKIAIMVEVFRQVDSGLISMDEKLRLEPRNMCIGSGILQYLTPGLEFTVRDLLTLMVMVPDNTASQMLWKRIGIQSVNMMIRDLGLAKTSIYLPWREAFLLIIGKGPYKDLSSHEAVSDWKGLSSMDRMRIINELDRDFANLPIEEFRKQYEEIFGVKEEKKVKIQKEYDQVFDNIGTPREVGIILEKILSGDVISETRSQEMLDLMIRSISSSSMPQMLSPDVPVAARSGVTSGNVNEAGIIYITPTSHVIICIFFKRLEERDPEEAQAAEAKVARLVYDHFSRVGAV